MLAVLLAAALAMPQEPLFPPRPSGFVTDVANVIPAERSAQITELVERVRAGSQGEIAVVTLPDIQGRDVGDIALQIGRAWGVGAAAEIGDRARNAGIVVLLIPRETSQDGRGYISIQVGQGAEGFVPDAVAGDIRREATPFLAAGDYGGGLALITARLAERYAAEFGFSLDSTLVPPRRQQRQEGIPPILIIIAFFVLLALLSRGGGGGGRGGRGRRRGVVFLPMGGGGFGGGFGGGGFGGGGFGGFGGGGGFSGGGSSGSF